MPEVSVDTYLRRKNTSRYERIGHEGVELLLAPLLVQQASRVALSVGRSWLRRRFEVEAVPRYDHFHGPNCRHG